MFSKKKKTSNNNKNKDKGETSKVAPASFAVSAYDHIAVDKPPVTYTTTTNNFQKGKTVSITKESYKKTNSDKKINPLIQKKQDDDDEPTNTNTTKPTLTYTDTTFYLPKKEDKDHYYLSTAAALNDDTNQERKRETTNNNNHHHHHHHHHHHNHNNNHNTPTTTTTTTTVVNENKKQIDPVVPPPPSTIETVFSPNQNPVVKDEYILPPSKKEEMSSSSKTTTTTTTKETTDESKSNNKTASVEESFLLGEPFSILSINDDKVPVKEKEKENSVKQKTSGNKTVDQDEKPTMERKKESNMEKMADRTPSIRPPPKHPLLVSTTIGQVPVFTIPGEEGYFPTGTKDEYLVRCSSTRIYQFLPSGGTIDTTSGKLLAEGPLTLCDPSPGIPEEVVLMGECEGIIFYLKKDDATVKLSNDDFVLFLPDECIGINLGSKEKEVIKLHVEGLLAYRTTFSEDLKKEDEFANVSSSDKHFQTMVLMSQWLSGRIVKGSEYGARKIEKFGKHKRSKITETKEVKISSTTMKTAKVTKKVAKGTNKVVHKVSDSISGAIGSAISNTVTPKSTDSKTKVKGRSLLLATTKSVAEVLDGIGEGFSNLSTSMKQEGTAYVEEKYGKEAGELARHTAGATIHFGGAILVARRVINPKSLMKSGVKQAVKKTIQKTNKQTNKQ